jgi:hypothetical protein
VREYFLLLPEQDATLLFLSLCWGGSEEKEKTGMQTVQEGSRKASFLSETQCGTFLQCWMLKNLQKRESILKEAIRSKETTMDCLFPLHPYEGPGKMYKLYHCQTVERYGRGSLRSENFWSFFVFR